VVEEAVLVAAAVVATAVFLLLLVVLVEIPATIHQALLPPLVVGAVGAPPVVTVEAALVVRVEKPLH
jgi:hypothetical protein